MTQVREQNGGYHRWSQNDQRLHFGLAGNVLVDQVVIEWPSGVVDVFPNAEVPTVFADQVYELREGMSSLDPVVLGGGAFPSAQAGDECGVPEFNAGLHEGIFLWKDCVTGAWSMRATAGWGPDAVYAGSVISDEAFLSISDDGLLEGADQLDTSVVGQILYSFGMSSGGRDGFSFELDSAASGCFDVEVPAGTQLLLGAGSIPAQWPLDLNTLGSCAAVPQVVVDDVTVNEAAGTATFTVSLSAASAEEVRVDYATADETATDPDDYTGVSGTLILAPDTLSGEVVVPIINDEQAEGMETFVLNLSAAVNALITDASGTATIEDNEVYACGEPSINQSSETGVFLWRDCPSNTWQMRVTAGGGPKIVYQGQVTAEQPFLLAPTEFSLEGADAVVGGVQSIQYSLNVANAGWDGFGFEMPASGQTCFEVEAPGGAQVYIGGGKDPVGNAVDLATLGACTPPPALPGLAVADVTVNEADGTATFTVNLSASSTDEVRVDYATADGTATDPDDYTGVSGTLILPPDTLSGEVVVPIIDDGDSEGAETFVLNLSNPANAELIGASATATIEDNEVYACGEPSINRASEAGVFLWRDCPSNTWQMRVTAGGGPKIVYQGQVTAEQSFPSAPTEFSWEGADSVVGSAQAIQYSLNVANAGWDGFGFEMPASGQTCFEVAAPSGAQIYVGAEKDPVLGSSVDLATIGACSSP
jgi:hypothetical protein